MRRKAESDPDMKRSQAIYIDLEQRDNQPRAEKIQPVPWKILSALYQTLASPWPKSSTYQADNNEISCKSSHTVAARKIQWCES